MKQRLSSEIKRESDLRLNNKSDRWGSIGDEDDLEGSYLSLNRRVRSKRDSTGMED